jgi:Na+-driven multidrug efflux pump
MDIYNITLYIHSLLRWLVVVLAVVTIAQAYMGWLGNGEYKKLNNALSASLVGSLHLQLLIGLSLYFFLSPFGYSIFSQGMKVVMKNAELRFWAVEHTTAMILAVVIAQVGRSLAKKSKESVTKFKREAIYYTVAVFLIFYSIPWSTRPWLR